MVGIGGSVGKTGLIDRDVSCNQQIHALTPIRSIIPKFLLHVIRSRPFQSEVQRLAEHRRLPIISKSKWISISVPLPPLTTQTRSIRVQQSSHSPFVRLSAAPSTINAAGIARRACATPMPKEQTSMNTHIFLTAQHCCEELRGTNEDRFVGPKNCR